MTIETLHILEGLDLQGMGHNSPDYLHALLEALKLSFADRHSYYGDPDFVTVPLAGLLSKEYAALRRAAIAMERASPEMPAAGDPWGVPARRRHAVLPWPSPPPSPATCRPTPATSAWSIAGGNAFSATPSDGVGQHASGAPAWASSCPAGAARRGWTPSTPASWSPASARA